MNKLSENKQKTENKRLPLLVWVSAVYVIAVQVAKFMIYFNGTPQPEPLTGHSVRFTIQRLSSYLAGYHGIPRYITPAEDWAWTIISLPMYAFCGLIGYVIIRVILKDIFRRFQSNS